MLDTKNLFPNLFPCQLGATIAKTAIVQPYINAIKQLVSSPSDIYQELYLTTLHQFCELCQAMPFSMQEENLPYGLLTQQLDLAIAALKLRRGKMLPPNSDSETIAQQEPLWTYALFTASLLTHIQRIQEDRTIVLYKNAHEQLGMWHPLAGSLFEPNTYYAILPKPPDIITRALVFKVALIGKILPSVALRWLAECPTVFNAWWETIAEERPTNTSILSNLILEAAEKIHYPLMPERETAETGEGEGETRKTAEVNKMQSVTDYLNSTLKN